MNIREKLTRYFLNMKIYYLSQLNNRKKLYKTSKIVYFDVHGSFGRSLYTLLFFFQEAGYKIYIKHRIGFISSLNPIGSYSQFILQIPNIYFSLKEPKRYQMKFCDHSSVKHEKSSIYLDDDYFYSGNNNTLHIPMSMHPLMYKNGYYYQSEEYLNNTSRTIKIFFAGNLDEKLYSNHVLHRAFGKLSRGEIYKILLKHFYPNTLLIAPSSLEFIFEDNTDRIVCVDSKKSISIPTNMLIKALSQCDFFLSLPGVVMPLCHNTVEAMSVGSIPILQHPELFYPRLEHGVNCIVFKDEEDLVLKIKKVLIMEKLEIENMRKNVIDYYDLNLSPKALIDKLENNFKKINRVYLNSEHNSVQQLQERLGISKYSTFQVSEVHQQDKQPLH